MAIGVGQALWHSHVRHLSLSPPTLLICTDPIYSKPHRNVCTVILILESSTRELLMYSTPPDLELWWQSAGQENLPPEDRVANAKWRRDAQEELDKKEGNLPWLISESSVARELIVGWVHYISNRRIQDEYVGEMGRGDAHSTNSRVLDVWLYHGSGNTKRGSSLVCTDPRPQTISWIDSDYI